MAFTLKELAQVAVEQEGEPDRAEPLLEESLSLARELESPPQIYRALYVMGLLAYAQHDYGRAQTLVEEALVLCQEQGDMRRVAVTSLPLGRLALEQGALRSHATGSREACSRPRRRAARSASRPRFCS